MSSEKEHSEASEFEIGEEVVEDEASESVEQLERDVKNLDNIPSVDMRDILAEESNRGTGMEEAIRYIS